MSGPISFRLTAPLQLPNRKMNLNWRVKGAMAAKARQALAWEVSTALSGQRPAQPFAYAAVQIFRHGIRAPDVDNLYASAKDLLDVLQPPTERRTFGLGIITDDAPNRCAITVRHVQARHRGDQCTVVVIRELNKAELEGMGL